jgi:hypothetical protein
MSWNREVPGLQRKGASEGAFSGRRWSPKRFPLKRERRGRPSKDEPVAARTVWRVKAVLEGRDQEQVATERHRRSAFTLITTVPKGELDAHGLLEEYTFRSSVEPLFSFTKHRRLRVPSS